MAEMDFEKAFDLEDFILKLDETGMRKLIEISVTGAGDNYVGYE